MIIRIENGLPIASIELEFGDHTLQLDNVLIDTGCAVNIFDTDVMAEIGVIIDFVNGIAMTMYVVGGKGEVCNQQKVNDLLVDGQQLDDLNLQLGNIQDMYGFDGLLGIDFMLETVLQLDFHTLEASYQNKTK